MADVFFAWELGTGRGHLTRMRPLMNYLLARCHRLTFAARELANVHKVLGDLDLTVQQAPLCHRNLNPEERRTVSFGQVLRNVGYHDADGLATMIVAWMNLLTVRRPALVVADHSPTALLAARTLGCRTAVLANGFMHPPPGRPFGPFRPDLSVADRRSLIDQDERLTKNVNRALRAVGGPPITELADIYSTVDDVYLCTVPEFDHFGARENAAYYGPVEYSAATARPEWPGVDEPKIYSYLYFHSGLVELLTAFAQAELNMLLYCNDIPPDLMTPFKGSSLRFADGPLDLTAVTEQAALGIVNANFSTTFELLTGGLPLVLVPIQAEQQLLSERLSETGAVATASIMQPQSVIALAHAMLADGRYREAAEALAARNGGTHWASAHQSMYERIAAQLGES